MRLKNANDDGIESQTNRKFEIHFFRFRRSTLLKENLIRDFLKMILLVSIVDFMILFYGIIINIE